MSSAPSLTESEILSDVLAPDQGDLAPEVAKTILRWKFSEGAVAQIERLATRNRNGTITPEERDQLQRFLRVGSLVNLLQAKARISLRGSRDTGE